MTTSLFICDMNKVRLPCAFLSLLIFHIQGFNIKWKGNIEVLSWTLQGNNINLFLFSCYGMLSFFVKSFTDNTFLILWIISICWFLWSVKMIQVSVRRNKERGEGKQGSKNELCKDAEGRAIGNNRERRNRGAFFFSNWSISDQSPGLLEHQERSFYLLNRKLMHREE